MKLTTTAPTALNFQEVLDRVPTAKEVFATTYGLGNKADNNLLLKAIRKMSKDASAVIITNVANQMLADENDRAAGQNETVNNYIAALDPAHFTCALESWFCFENHAKIVIVDDLAYIGSANLTHGSKYRFEAGVVTDDKNLVAELREFIGEIRFASVPRSTIQGSREIQTLLAFAASAPQLIERFESEAGEWKIDPWTGDGSFVASADRLSCPHFLDEAVSRALHAIEAIDERTFSKFNQKLPQGAISVKTQLERIASTMASIDEDLPKKINEVALGDELVEKHLWLSNDGKVDQVVTNAINDDILATVEENEQNRDRFAEQCFESIRRGLTEISTEIRKFVTAPAPHPRLTRIKPVKF